MKEKKTGEFVGNVIGNVIALIIVNSVPAWRHLTAGVVLESWSQILWAANLSLAVQIVGNALLAAWHPRRVVFLVQALCSAAALVSVVVFYHVFPLDFAAVGVGWVNTLFRVFLVIGIVGTSIAVVVQGVRFAIASLDEGTTGTSAAQGTGGAE